MEGSVIKNSSERGAVQTALLALDEPTHLVSPGETEMFEREEAVGIGRTLAAGQSKRGHRSTLVPKRWDLGTVVPRA